MFPVLKGQPEDASDSRLKDSDYWSTAVLNIILNILKQSGKYCHELGIRQHKGFLLLLILLGKATPCCYVRRQPFSLEMYPAGS